MRAELGPPTHDLYYVGPDRILVSALGTRRFLWFAFHPVGYAVSESWM